MKLVKVTSKGQVTIPIETRERLGIDEGTHLEVTVEGSSVLLRKHASARPLGDDDPIWELLGSRGSGKPDVSADHDRHLATAERKRWRAS